MGLVVDHLQADHVLTVLQDFTDARGVKHTAGETAVLRRMELDWQRQELCFEWERDGARETLYFAVAAKEGPRNGKMRDYFAKGERIALPEDTIKGRRALAKPPEVPELVEAPVTDPKQYGEAVNRIWALAAKHRFDEAEAQIQLLIAPDDPFGGRLQMLAGDVVRIAVAHVRDADRTVFNWARERGIHLLYAWGSGATSGGEGTVRRKEMSAVEAYLERAEAEAVE